MSQKQVTIYDIAREAGVSAATVSRILANSAGVKPEKRQRVMELVEKYHFRPNAMAKGLSKSRSRLIGMLCPDVRNPFYANVFAACEQAAYEAGYTLVLNSTFAQVEKEIAFMQRMVEQRVDSLIICGGVVDWRPLPENFVNTLRQCLEQLPVVIVGEAEEIACHQIALDQEGGMRQAVQHLAALGHERIAFLHGHPYIYQTQAKIRAFRQCMAELNLPLPDDYVLYGGAFDQVDGFHGMNRLMALPQPPTAVIATNDMMCVGALQAINRMGYSVPEDFSLMGFDDVYLTELTQPHLSSIHLDYDAYGKLMVDTAIRALDRSLPAEKQSFPVTLAIKESCRRIEQGEDV